MKIGVILASVRPNRNGERVAKWVMSLAKEFSGAQLELLDLKEYPLPLYDELDSPDSLPNGYSHTIATQWAKKIGEMDGFILVMGEYNHTPIPSLVNAIDYINEELDKKPVAFVSYSTGQYAGVRAVQEMRLMLLTMNALPLNSAVHISHVETTIDENGILIKESYQQRFVKLKDQLIWWTKLLKSARKTSS